MMRWVWFFVCAILGLVLVFCGWLIPAHLRAVDTSVVQKAGRRTPGLVDRGLVLVGEKRVGAAQLLWQAAVEEKVPGRERLGLAISNSVALHRGWQVWGGGESHLEVLFGTDPGLPKVLTEPFTKWVVRLENRGTLLSVLRGSARPLVQELLKGRSLTNTAIFSPSGSSSGQALDAALSVGGLLAEEGKLSGGLSNKIYELAFDANRGGNSEPLELVLLDFMSLGQRYNWGQLEVFVGQIENSETLRILANAVRKAENAGKSKIVAKAPIPASSTPASNVPEQSAPTSANGDDPQPPNSEFNAPAVLYAAVVLSGHPAEVAKYIMNFSESGLIDLGTSLRSGTGGVNELLSRNQRLYTSKWRQQMAVYEPFYNVYSWAADYSRQMPWPTLGVKWFMLLAGGFFLALAVHHARPAASALERPLQVSGLHVAREFLFALGFLVVVLLLSEPFLAQESQKVEMPLRLRLPTVGAAAATGPNSVKSTLMNQIVLLTILLFFVLQGLIYIACLVKLAEIRRQRVLARVKLKLLENEEHLFDAGLYLGFVGTIISFILVSVGVIKPSLMAAYSSTSLGIIFVSFFKIFHLRPYRRQLVMESEYSPAPATATQSSAPVLVTPP